MQLQDWYPAVSVPAAPAAPAPASSGAGQTANVQAAGKITQSVEGSLSASGHTAAWFLAVVALALVMYTMD
jgi:hypothetical protein